MPAAQNRFDFDTPRAIRDQLRGDLIRVARNYYTDGETRTRTTAYIFVEFLVWTFNVEHGDAASPDACLRQTAEELAGKYMVSRSTMKNILRAARDSGLLIASQSRYRTGGQRENEFRIDVQAVRRLSASVSRDAQPDRESQAPPPDRRSGPAPRRSDPAPRRSDPAPRRSKRDLYNRNIPTQEQTIDQTATTNAADWRAAAAALSGLGISKVQSTIREAKANDLSPSDVLSIVAEYRENAKRFRTVGAVRYRIAEGSWPRELSPPAAPPKAASLEPHDAAGRIWRIASQKTKTVGWTQSQAIEYYEREAVAAELPRAVWESLAAYQSQRERVMQND